MAVFIYKSKLLNRPVRLIIGLGLMAILLFIGNCGIGITDEGPSLDEFDEGPVIFSLEPASGFPGTGVIVRGTGFSPDTSANIVTFNDTDAPVEAATDTMLQVVVPEGASTGPVEVTAREKSAVGPVFTVLTDGFIEVTVSTTGFDLDTDGYTLVLDGGSESLSSGINDTLFFAGLGEGLHDVELTGTADNCSVSGNNPRSLDVSPGDTTTTQFDVACRDIIKNQIVFSSDRDGNREIYVMGTDGSGQTNISNNTAADLHPAVSSDGSKIVFVSDRDGNDEIFKMNADGSGVEQLTFTSGEINSNPIWSPDGSRIAFTRFTGAQNFEIFVMNADGSSETNITNNSADEGQPDWSPDGSLITFTSNRDGDGEIFVMAPDGSSVVQLTNNTSNDQSPAWSPDGNQIAYRDESLQSPNIFIMDSNGANQSALTNTFSVEDFPDWSPDGTQIVYQTDQPGDVEIFLINIDGTGNTNLSNVGSANDRHPSWSPVQ